MITENFKNKVVDFQMDDCTDDIYFEGCDDTLTEEFMNTLMSKVRICEWFHEGNKTEGMLTFQSDIEFTIDWVVKVMGEDWSTDREEDYTQSVIVNMDDTQYKVINW
jgi:hypothetical protein